MKKILFAWITVLISGCCSTGIVEYQQVSVVPVKTVAVVPMVTEVAVIPAKPMIQPVLVDYVEPINVTTTRIDFY